MTCIDTDVSKERYQKAAQDLPIRNGKTAFPSYRDFSADSEQKRSVPQILPQIQSLGQSA